MASPWSPESPQAGLAVPEESGSDALAGCPWPDVATAVGRPHPPGAVRLLQSGAGRVQRGADLVLGSLGTSCGHVHGVESNGEKMTNDPCDTPTH